MDLGGSVVSDPRSAEELVRSIWLLRPSVEQEVGEEVHDHARIFPACESWAEVHLFFLVPVGP